MIGARELSDLNRARQFLADIVARHPTSCLIFLTIAEAIEHIAASHKKCRQCVEELEFQRENYLVQNKLTNMMHNRSVSVDSKPKNDAKPRKDLESISGSSKKDSYSSADSSSSSKNSMGNTEQSNTLVNGKDIEASFSAMASVPESFTDIPQQKEEAFCVESLTDISVHTCEIDG